jgi:PAS domain S-box
MIPDFYKKIIFDSTFGYSYSRIVRNDEGTPVDYEFLDVNESFAKMMGLPVDGLVGHRVTEVIEGFGHDSFDWIGFFAHVTDFGEKREFEEFSSKLDRWYHLSVISPEPEHFVVLSFDITDKRKAELSLIVSEERNRRYIDNAPDGIFISDSNGKYEHVNPAGCKLLGYDAREMLTMSIGDIMADSDKETSAQAWNTLKREGHVARKGRLRKKDGSAVIVLIESVALPERQFMSFCKDITREEIAAQEKERYYTAFQSTSQSIVITDREGTILAINDAVVDMYGYTQEEAIGKNPKVLNPGREVYENLGYSSENYDNLFKGLWKAVRDPTVRTWQGVVINRRKNGSLVWVNLIVNAVYNDRNELESIIGLPVDITHSHEKENRTRILLFQTIADLAELRDDDTGNHMKRVGIFTRLLAKACGMNEKYCADIEIFAPMHDIGKVGILDSILRAPRKLTDEEFEIMKTHTILGNSIVKGKADFAMAAAITLCHHEKFDGTGYPKGLKGKSIPLSAQITAVADVYDALRSKRSYKEAWTHEDTVDYIVGNSGKQFDPDLIAKFTLLHARFETVYRELMD